VYKIQEGGGRGEEKGRMVSTGTGRKGGGGGGGNRETFLHTIVQKFYLFDVRNCKLQPPPALFSRNRISLCFKEINSKSLLTCDLSVHTKLNKYFPKFTEFLINFIVFLN
jgi:hypothetical protein